jgi:hypothetical protein
VQRLLFENALVVRRVEQANVAAIQHRAMTGSKCCQTAPAFLFDFLNGWNLFSFYA